MRLAWCRLEHTGGHEAAYGLLAQLVGAPLPEICRTPLGKPFFKDEALHFSISHTRHHAFCCVSEQNVGIDAEEMGRPVDPRLADRFLSETEKARVAVAPDKNDALLRLWVLKEAAAKCSGEGLRGYPNKTDFSPDDPRVQQIDGCYVAVIE